MSSSKWGDPLTDQLSASGCPLKKIIVPGSKFFGVTLSEPWEHLTYGAELHDKDVPDDLHVERKFRFTCGLILALVEGGRISLFLDGCWNVNLGIGNTRFVFDNHTEEPTVTIFFEGHGTRHQISQRKETFAHLAFNDRAQMEKFIRYPTT